MSRILVVQTKPAENLLLQPERMHFPVPSIVLGSQERFEHYGVYPACARRIDVEIDILVALRILGRDPVQIEEYVLEAPESERRNDQAAGAREGSGLLCSTYRRAVSGLDDGKIVLAGVHSMPQERQTFPVFGVGPEIARKRDASLPGPWRAPVNCYGQRTDDMS